MAAAAGRATWGHRRGPRAALVVVAVLLGALALALGTAGGMRPAGAAQRAVPDLGVLPVALASLAPVVPQDGDTLVITGTVTNTTPSAVTDVEVGLRISPTPVRTRSELTDILSGSTGRTGVAVPGSRVNVAASLEPGARAAFRLEVPVADLDLPQQAEVAVLGVESLAQVPGDGQGLIQTGLTRVFLPWFPVPGQVAPTGVVWLFPLTSAPARGADGVFLDDHLASEVAPQGRLSRLLDAAAGAPTAISWVIDPALLQSLQAMAEGYTVRTPTGELVSGAGGPDAAAWLARLRLLTAGADVTATSYADPDVVALHRAGLDVDIALAATTARDLPARVLGRPVDGGLSWPPEQVIDDGTLDVLRASGTREIVLSATTLPPTEQLTYTPSGSVDLATGGTPLRAVLSDPTISRLVGAPYRASDGTRDTGPLDPVVRRQQALAEIAMVSLELPAVSRTIVVAPPGRWSAYGGSTAGLVAALDDAPWALPVSLATLLATPPSDVPRSRTDYPPRARAAELPQSYLRRVGTARSDLAALRSVAPDAGATSTSGLDEALTRSESAAWRTDLASGEQVLAGTVAAIDAQTAAVHVLSRAPVSLPGDTGVIPVTVANDLDRPARVGVRLVGTPVTRFSSTDVAPVTIQPGQKATLEVAARVVGSGPVDVGITLLTPEGQRFGQPVLTQVGSTAYARAAQWVVGGLFAVLVLLLGINFVRRRRGGAAEAEAPHD